MERYPQIMYTQDNTLIVRADLVFPGNYSSDTGEYVIADAAVTGLFINAKKGDKKAEEILMELCGNYMNKLAFNALNHLGKMANINTPDSRQGFAEYLFDAYKNYDIEKLKLIAFWSYPQFSYKEYDRYSKCIFSTNNETEFVDHLYKEMTESHLRGEEIKMKIRKIGESFVTDILIGNKLSTFSFYFTESTFIGIERVWSD